ncbi:putative esterase [anaerobic digester metagenome]
MKKAFIPVFAISLLLTGIVRGQVTFLVTSLPANTPAQDILYISGDFTGWNPGSPAYAMQKNTDGNWYITLAEQAEGTEIRFKFTRGSWATVEKGPSGEEIADRRFTFGNGQTVEVTIHNWADGGSGNNSTAASNVHIMDEDFFIPQLNRSRRIWIYLPPDYDTSGKDYPVLYMHDGQNLFDSNTSFSGEWQVDETLNAMAGDGIEVPVVVGIDNGGIYRIAEYTPWANQQYGGGDGDAYIRFIVETLKPYIDQNYRTLPGKDHTGIMGSSLGGLISHYGALRYQQTFSKAGIFSPSYWFSDSVWSFTQHSPKQANMKFYQLCGTLEGENTVAHMLRMSDSLETAGFSQEEIFNKVVEGGQHNEALWRDNFREAMLWLFGNGPASVQEQAAVRKLILSPNPAQEYFRILNQESLNADSLIITDISGQVAKEMQFKTKGHYNIRNLKPGTYLIRLQSEGYLYEGKLIRGK